MYVAANVVLMVMLWFYHRARHRQQLMRRETDEGEGGRVLTSAGCQGGA